VSAPDSLVGDHPTDPTKEGRRRGGIRATRSREGPATPAAQPRSDSGSRHEWPRRRSFGPLRRPSCDRRAEKWADVFAHDGRRSYWTGPDNQHQRHRRKHPSSYATAAHTGAGGSATILGERIVRTDPRAGIKTTVKSRAVSGPAENKSGILFRPVRCQRCVVPAMAFWFVEGGTEYEPTTRMVAKG